MRALAVDASASVLRGVRVVRSGERLTVARAAVVAASVPASVPAAAEELPREASAAAAAELVRALGGDASEPAVVALARERVLLAIAELPSDDEAELRAMARLAIARDVTPEGADGRFSGDFQYLEREALRSTALVVAVPAAEIERARALAGFAAGRVALRALGMAALVRTDPTLRAGMTLAVDIARDAIECTVVRDGVFLHARGAALAPSAAGPAQAVLQEFRRAVAALRAALPGFAPTRTLVSASREIFDAVGAPMQSIAGCASVHLVAHARVSAADAQVEQALCDGCWPLVGLLLEDDAAAAADGRAIDLLHPTPPIDVAAKIRERALLLAGIVVVAALAGWTLGKRSWNALESRHDDLETKARGALVEISRAKRDELRLGHIAAFERLAPDWLAHLDALRRFAPDPSAVVLDGLSAQLSGTDIEYSADRKFVAAPELKFILDGEAKDRTVADALRDALVKEKGYTLGSTGADARGGRRLPYPFAYTLRTADLAPKSTSSNGGPASKGSDPAASGSVPASGGGAS